MPAAVFTFLRTKSRTLPLLLIVTAPPMSFALPALAPRIISVPATVGVKPSVPVVTMRPSRFRPALVRMFFPKVMATAPLPVEITSSVRSSTSAKVMLEAPVVNAPTAPLISLAELLAAMLPPAAVILRAPVVSAPVREIFPDTIVVRDKLSIPLKLKTELLEILAALAVKDNVPTVN